MAGKCRCRDLTFLFYLTFRFDTKAAIIRLAKQLNTTESGPYDMKRGIENVHELGNIVAYNNMTTMTQWGDPYCGQLNGSDSSIFPPIEGNPPKRIYTYEPELCRSLYATLVDKRDIFNISAYYYEIDEMLLASKSANPANKCFCKNVDVHIQTVAVNRQTWDWSSSHDGCLLMGVFNLNPCKNVPAIVSLPHFYLASEELLEYFDGGISPDKEKHRSFAYLDATTGVVIKGTQRLQFNIELRNVNTIPQLQDVKTGLFPLLWIEEGAEISEELRQELQTSHKMLSYVEAFRWAILGLAVILCIASAMCVSRAGGLNPWPRNHNSVSFILRPGNTVDINKGR